jgi:BirA family biotin operon repressor/biotin-[acetyl-CoA-carboxylase] ligase
MDPKSLEVLKSDLGLGSVRYYPRLSSTNDIAVSWAAEGAPDLSLVVADEQTMGKGRAGRRWYTPAGSALAFSLILSPACVDLERLPCLTGLGALAVKETLANQYGLPARIKWPNDVLLQRRKVAGVLVEAHWVGSRINSLILGVGINVASGCVEEIQQREPQLNFPATCIERVAGFLPDRLELLKAVLSNLLDWLPHLAEGAFLQAWESSLEFRGEWVQVDGGENFSRSSDLATSTRQGKVLGLAPDGALQLLTHSGEVVALGFGEIRLKYPQQEA